VNGVPFSLQPTLARQEWVVEVAYDPVSKLVTVRSRGGLPDADTGVRILREGVKLAERQAARVGQAGLIGPSGVPLVKEGLTS